MVDWPRVTVRGREFHSQGPFVRRFIERLCRLSDAEWAGRPFRLMPWQRELVDELFEVDPATGLRVYRRALIGLPRKSGKSQLAAALALYLMLADGEPSAAVYCAAASEDQADVVFEAARRMAMTPPLSALCEVPSRNIIASRGDPFSALHRLSGKGSTKHGLNIHGVILDELHAWGVGQQEEMWQALVTGSGARRQPLQIAITTAGADLEQSRCGQLYLLGRELEERGQDAMREAGFLFRWWQAPDGCDHRDPAMWRLASPSYGVIVSEGFYRAELATIPEAAFRRFYLNQWVRQGDVPWVDAAGLDEGRVPQVEFSPDEPVFLGVDLSESRDATAVAAVQLRNGPGRPCSHTSGPCLWVDVRVWEPPRLPDGRLDFSWELPVAEVLDHIMRRYAELRASGAVFDPWHSRLIQQQLAEEGLAVEEVWQQGARRARATAVLRQYITEGRCHWAEPAFRRHVMGATVKSTTRGGEAIVKSSSGARIDAAMAAIHGVYGLEFLQPTSGRLVMAVASV